MKGIFVVLFTLHFWNNFFSEQSLGSHTTTFTFCTGNGSGLGFVKRMCQLGDRDTRRKRAFRCTRRCANCGSVGTPSWRIGGGTCAHSDSFGTETRSRPDRAQTLCRHH